VLLWLPFSGQGATISATLPAARLLLPDSSGDFPAAGIAFVYTGSLGERECAGHRQALLALLTRLGI
jgi:hypothetical protein